MSPSGVDAEIAPDGLFHEIAAELALHDVETELEENVEALAQKLSGDDSGEDINDQMLEREKSFFRKVYKATIEMAERQPGPVTTLFDIDYTLIHSDPETVRPSFELAIRELDNVLGERFTIGILSTRPKDKIGRNGKNTLYGSIVDLEAGRKIDSDFLISSGDLERSDENLRGLVRGSDTRSKVEAVKDILDPEIAGAVRQGEIDVYDFFDAKLPILQKLGFEYPYRSFVMVDDLPLASAIEQDGINIKGVRVNEEILDAVIHPYSQVGADRESLTA